MAGGRLEQQSADIDGRGGGADLGRLWRVADDDAPVGDTRFSVAEALSEASVKEELAQTFCGVMLATKYEASVSLYLLRKQRLER